MCSRVGKRQEEQVASHCCRGGQPEVCGGQRGFACTALCLEASRLMSSQACALPFCNMKKVSCMCECCTARWSGADSALGSRWQCSYRSAGATQRQNKSITTPPGLFWLRTGGQGSAGILVGPCFAASVAAIEYDCVSHCETCFTVSTFLAALK